MSSSASQAVVNKRQQQVNSNYHNQARKLDEDEGFHNAEDGPFTQSPQRVRRGGERAGSSSYG
jgi:hypothetical protein